MLKSAKENCGNGSCHTRSLHQALVHFVLSTGEKCHRSCSSAIALISPCGQGQAAAESRKDAGETARSPLPCGQRQGSRRARRASGHPGTHRPVPSRPVPCRAAAGDAPASRRPARAPPPPPPPSPAPPRPSAGVSPPAPRRQLTQLELLAPPAGVPPDPAPENGPGVGHRAVGGPAGPRGARHEPAGQRRAA